MGIAFFFKDYMVWHYGTAVRDFFGLISNFLWFGCNFFSIPLLLSTFFAPFYRIRLKQDKSLDLESIFGTIAVNVITRLVGILLRSIMILVGLVCELVIIVAGVILFIVWLALPVLIPALIINGLVLIL